MEALVALGVASNVIQFVDFTAKLLSQTVQIYRYSTQPNSRGPADQHGDHEAPNELKRITQDFNRYSRNLVVSLDQARAAAGVQQTPADEEIFQMCRECTRLSSKLLAVLKSLESSGSTIWSSFVAALRTSWSEREVEGLRQALDSYRQQLSLYLLTAVRHEITRLQQDQTQLYTNVKKTREVVENFFTNLKTEGSWERDVLRAMFVDYEEKQSRGQSDVAMPAEGMEKNLSDVDRDRFNKGLLQWLHFTNIDDRHQQVPRAYRETFEWIFGEPSNGEQSNLSEWLTDETQPLYWVKGKPASGKSTLMKFIYTDPRTTALLHRWVGDKQLITCAFYFWNSGAPVQMSQEGMGRTLLHSALLQAPRLWKALFPHHMEQFIAYNYPWQRQITWEEITRALRLLVKGAGNDYRLFFFIDGLDEFDGKHNTLVAFIHDLLSLEVKACVSSRPWNIFEDNFRNYPKLRLEDLTYGDIKLYVEERLSQNPGFHERQRETPEETKELIESITHKAAGVFLWVRLVTDSLLEGLTDGDRLSDLRSRLDALPSDLEALFWKILERLEPAQLKHTAQLLQILRASIYHPTLLLLSYADEETPDYVSNCINHPLSADQIDARVEIFRRRLNACCKGLLEPNPVRTVLLRKARVEYLHRTVKDFVERPDIWSKFLGMTDTSFNANSRLCNAHILLLPPKGTTLDRDRSEDFSYYARMAFEHAARAMADGPGDTKPQYLEHITELIHSYKQGREGLPYLLFEVTMETFSSFRDLLLTSNSSELELLRTILESGANPNQKLDAVILRWPEIKTGTYTPWEACLHSYSSNLLGSFYDSDKEELSSRFAQIWELYLAYGADPTIVNGELPSVLIHLAKKKIRESKTEKKRERSRKIKNIFSKIIS